MSRVSNADLASPVADAAMQPYFESNRVALAAWAGREQWRKMCPLRVDTSAEQITGAEMSVAGVRTRKRRSLQEKLQIVRETLQSEASVAVIARRHGVNANQVFTRRRQYQRGQLTYLHVSPKLLRLTSQRSAKWLQLARSIQ